MLKLFQLVRSVHLGGAEMVAFNLAEFCKASYPDKFKFTVVELHQTNDAYSRDKKKYLSSKNIRILSLGSKSKILSLLFGPFVWHIIY